MTGTLDISPPTVPTQESAGRADTGTATLPRGASPEPMANQNPRSTSVPPHGGQLINRLVTGDEARDTLARAATLGSVRLDARTAADAELLATGALSPLDGFVRHDDYVSIVRDMRLASGRVFSIPISLAIPQADRGKYAVGQDVALTVADGSRDGRIVGVLSVDDIFALDREAEAKEVYRTTDAAHPGVAYLYENRGFALGGRLTLAARTIVNKYPAYAYDPAELRNLLQERGFRRTVAFQTRNPIHRAHEYLLRCALEVTDGLVVHPLVGETKGDDVPADTRMRCYEALLEGYFPKNRALLAVFPFAMRYAGPREAVLHAVARQNYGFSHFIVGRDHAGVGNYYGTYDAQRIFDDIRPDDLAITPIFFEHSFYCRGCGGVSSLKTCPHEPDQRLVLSGTRVRELLTQGEGLPPEYSRPEVARILVAAYREKAAKEGAS